MRFGLEPADGWSYHDADFVDHFDQFHHWFVLVQHLVTQAEPKLHKYLLYSVKDY